MCRTPQWLKKIFANITKSERNGPVFRFFMDLGDAGMLFARSFAFVNRFFGWKRTCTLTRFICFS